MPKTAQKGASVATVKKQGAVMKHIKKYWQWYAMMFIPIVYYIVFRYIPMFGNIIAFRRYRAGSSIFGDEWSGLKYFRQVLPPARPEGDRSAGLHLPRPQGHL
mgnify:CR=1 FL=1